MEILQSQVSIAEQIIIGVLLSALFALALKYAVKGLDYLESKKELITDEKARTLFVNALEDMKKLITTNITSAETTLKPAILQAIADGKVDKSELSSLAVTVNDNVLKQLGTDTIAVLNKNLGDTNSYLANKTEEILTKLKADPTSVVSNTVIPEATTITTTKNATVDASTIIAENEALLNTLQSAISSVSSTGATVSDPTSSAGTAEVTV